MVCIRRRRNIKISLAVSVVSGLLLNGFHLHLANGFVIEPRIRFGCYIQKLQTPGQNLFSAATQRPVTHLDSTVSNIGECLGSGSYGTVHYITVESDDGEKNTHVGKRAWTKPELMEQNPDLSNDKLKDKSTRCRYYWTVEKHCFEKISPTSGLPRYECSVKDEEGRPWMAFEILEKPASEPAAISVQDLLERDRLDHKLHESHHLYFTSLALGLPKSATLTATLDFFMQELLENLAHIHEYSIVHRDVKPSNLLVSSKEDGTSKLVLIDFGSAADLETAGLLKENVGLSSRVAISPVYAAPEIFVDSTDGAYAVNFDCFSAALLFCQLLFQYLDERTESAFRQQLESANWDLDAWLNTALQSKVRPAMLEDAFTVLAERPGLWKLLQDMLKVDPYDRLSSSMALKRWNKILDNGRNESTRSVSQDSDLIDGAYLLDVFGADESCAVDVPAVRPLQFVASFLRKDSLGLYLTEAADAETDDMDDSRLQLWIDATTDAFPGDVFVQGIVPGSQAETMGIFEIGDKVEGIGELPIGDGGFEKAVAMLQDQPKSSKYVTLHFTRTSSSVENNETPMGPSVECPIQISDRGAWQITGRRKTQEDAFILHEVHDTTEKTILVAGVLDGHLGAAASNFVQEELPITLSSALNLDSEESLLHTLEASWNECCDSYRISCLSEDCVAEYDPVEGILMASTSSEGAVAGTTATIFALDRQTSRLAALNCGDSRGLVVTSKGRLKFQTRDHTPQSETQRLIEGSAQGYKFSIPTCRFGRYSLEVGDYTYAVARSLEGTLATSKGIVSLADLNSIQVETGDAVLVATDGLWEVIDSAEACDILTKLRSQNTSAGDAAKTLCSLAHKKGTSDNVSAVIIYLD